MAPDPAKPFARDSDVTRPQAAEPPENVPEGMPATASGRWAAADLHHGGGGVDDGRRLGFPGLCTQMRR